MPVPCLLEAAKESSSPLTNEESHKREELEDDDFQELATNELESCTMLPLGAPVRDLFLGPPWPSRKGSRIEAVESTDRSPSPDPNPAVPQDCLPGPPQIEPASPLTGSSPWLLALRGRCPAGSGTTCSIWVVRCHLFRFVLRRWRWMRLSTQGDHAEFEPHQD